jgi:hypothetical protein
MSQAQTSSAPFSIIDELLGGPRPLTPAVGATSLIQRLLEAAANEAVEAQCDVLTGYSLVKTASAQSRAIDESILKIDENGTDEAAWTIFDNYVKDIQKLESYVTMESISFTYTFQVPSRPWCSPREDWSCP